MSLNKLVPEWGPETVERRLHACVSMLYIHGFLAETERDRVRRRLLKQRRKAAETHDA